jgi:hypothetical protein
VLAIGVSLYKPGDAERRIAILTRRDARLGTCPFAPSLLTKTPAQ